ncbi:MAG: hypothetical protein HS115_10580 [Spirochaetales bacterium]|nr:hypothetical protein [Spirochaetales bacterium]
MICRADLCVVVRAAGLFLLWATALMPQEALYRRPSEVIASQTLDNIAAALEQEEPDYSEIARIIHREINNYTTQFIEEKRIQDERRVAERPNLDKNTLRLITLLKEKKYGKIEFAGHSPYLRQLYEWLGRCYEEIGDPYLALSAYSEALRYTALERQKQPDGTAEERLAIYQSMAASFAHPERIPEERDAARRDAAERVGRLLPDYVQARRRTDLALKAIDVARADQVRGGNLSVAGAENNYGQEKSRLDALEGELERIRKNEYRQFQEERAKSDGYLAFRMATVVKKLEITSKEFARIFNRSSFYRGTGDELGEERTALRNFVGYAIFLEFAHKLDPDNINYVALLAEEYRSSQNRERAIEFSEKFLTMARGTAEQENVAAGAYRLAGLYTEVRNYIKAEEHYKEFLNLSQDETRKAQAELTLARIAFEYTGRMDLARDLFERSLRRKETQDESAMDFRLRSDSRATRYQIHGELASIFRRELRTPREKEELEKARQIYYAIEAETREYLKEEEDLKKQIFTIKKDLLGREDPDLQKDYYRLLRIDLPAVQEKVRYLRVRQSSLGLPALLERLALLARRDRDFPTALDLYQEIITRGNGEEATRARSNIEQVNLTLKDGRIREAVLPSRFER